MKKFILILVLLVAATVYAQDGNTSGGEQLASTFSCELISFDPAYDGFRQQCLKEKYFGLAMQGFVTLLANEYATQNTLNESAAQKLADNAWVIADVMVAKRNKELAGN